MKDLVNVKTTLKPSKPIIFLLLLRPKQWSKNLLLFAGLIFSYSFTNPVLILYSLLGFISFCLLSSATYIINDILDIAEDRMHPLKKDRPIAAGLITPGQAVMKMITILLVALALAWYINLHFFLSGLIYFLLTLSYSLWLKHIVIMDVFAIAFGFLIRAMAGAIAIGVSISSWFLICTLLLSLFLALTKRRQESINLVGNGINHRRVLEHYPLPFLDQLISIVTASTIMGYSLYTFTASKSDLFMITIPFVVYGIFRYLYLVYKQDLGESPEEILLKDKPLIINIFLWVIISALILAFEQGALL